MRPRTVSRLGSSLFVANRLNDLPVSEDVLLDEEYELCFERTSNTGVESLL